MQNFRRRCRTALTDYAEILHMVGMSTVLNQAIELAGGQDAFMAKVPVRPRTLADWRRYGVPDTRALDVERAADYQIKAEQLAVERMQLLRASPQGAA